MVIKPLKIGNLIADMPIIQGGMGVGVSRSRLAAAVANEGGVGIISLAQVGYDEDGFTENPFKANINAIKKHIQNAKAKATRGIIGVNIMVALNHFDEYVKAAIEAGVDLIIAGAGLPTKLPELVKNTKVKIAPIVSSLKALKTILKVWDKKHKRCADLVVIEGPKAGGHLGYSLDDLVNDHENIDQMVIDIINEVKEYEAKYNMEIPVVVGGGVYTGADIAHYLSLGASGAQIATRFIATDECDADLNYKKAFIECKENEIEIIKSPVGMPGRAIRNKFVDRIKQEQIKVKKCLNCLKIDHCDRVTIPYCITEALIKAVQGDVEDGLLFCGENAHRVNKIVSVHELMEEFREDLLKFSV